jgi:hypothetical protein
MKANQLKQSCQLPDGVAICDAELRSKDDQAPEQMFYSPLPDSVAIILNTIEVIPAADGAQYALNSSRTRMNVRALEPGLIETLTADQDISKANNPEADLYGK